MKRATLQVAALCAFGTLALALFLLSGCYLGQEGTALVSTFVDAGAVERAELDAENVQFSGINDASVAVDASADLELRDSSAELLERDGCIAWELALPSSCARDLREAHQ